MLHRSRISQLNFIMTVIGLMHNAIYTGVLSSNTDAAVTNGPAMLFCSDKKAAESRTAVPVPLVHRGKCFTIAIYA